MLLPKLPLNDREPRHGGAQLLDELRDVLFLGDGVPIEPRSGQKLTVRCRKVAKPIRRIGEDNLLGLRFEFLSQS